jgi:Uma2 family endonuclease
MEELREVSKAKGLVVSNVSGLELPPTRERIEPDVLVLQEPGQLPGEESYMPARHALLVAEVVSPSSVREDREVKPRSCGLAGVPFYLLVDRHVEPVTVTLFTEPGEKGYANAESVAVGGKLRIPEPFGITLDTSALPLPRPASSQTAAESSKG